MHLISVAAPAAPPPPSQPLSLPPVTWAAEAASNEITVIERDDPYIRYRMHVIDEKGNQLRDIVETRDGTVARLIQRDDRRLTEQEDKAEQQRLNDLIASPAAYQKHINNEAIGKKHAIELMRLLPEAMLYTYTPGQPQIETSAGEQVVVDFKPNPAWRPPSFPAEALTGLQGRVWIDIKTRHMVRMEGDIFQGVNVGWGMLAHVYPGGKLSLEQTKTVNGRWIFSRFTEQITVRALMVKTIHQSADISTANYQVVSPMPYQDAIRILLATPLPR